MDYLQQQCKSSSGAAQGSPCGKTSTELLAVTGEMTFLQWLVKWQDSTDLAPPPTAGAKRAQRWAMGACSNGSYWTRNGSELRKDAAAFSLSETLETGPVDPPILLEPWGKRAIPTEVNFPGANAPPGNGEGVNSTLAVSGNAIGRQPHNGPNGISVDGSGVMYTLTCLDRHAVISGGVSRRLTPLECERLQGFPDNYTLVNFKGGPAPDSGRYKAMGNSMAVPVMAHIGRKIKEAVEYATA